jgi:hypothetical protein
MKYSSTCCGASSSQILLSDSTAWVVAVVSEEEGCRRAGEDEAKSLENWGTHLVSHDGLLDGGEVLKGREEHVAPLSSSDILYEAAELLAQGDQDLVLILDRFIKKRDELLPGALRTEGESDGGQPVNGAQAEQDVIVLELIDENRNRVQLVGGVGRVSHCESTGRMRECRAEPPSICAFAGDEKWMGSVVLIGVSGRR